METENSRKNAPTILIVDDISVNVTILENILTHEGYEAMTALSVQEALGLMKQTRPDLILSDLSMPEIDGLEFCRMLKNDQATRDIPFIFITVLNTSKEKEEAFTAGAVDFIPKPFDNVEVLMRVSNHLNSYRLQQEMSDYNRMMHKLVEDQKNQIEKEHTNVLRALSRIVKKLDPEGGKHRSNVGYNCNLLAQGLQFSPAYEDEITDEFVEAIGVAARLHDIGRFLVQEENSDRESMEYIKKCAEEGSSVIEEFGADQEHRGALEMTRCIARYHHAHWDGSGYPQVQGRQIPLEARIAAVANDFDEMTAPKREGTALTPEEGQKRIKEMSGIYYDPDVVEVFDKLHSRMRTN
ncbi:MAG: response regulator [Lachnospiraceae bacterium]|nr:response regulator [Lachnospiraceae bacterium]